MSAPAALANAVADALGLDRLELPLTPPRVWEALNA
jgi:CO/xanthine dehydrogenase Mo-binding subunit